MWNPKSVTSLSFMNMSWTCVLKKKASDGHVERLEAKVNLSPNERFTRSLKKAACYNVGWINGDIMGISCKYHVDQWKYHGDVTKNLFVMGKWCLTNGFSLTLIHVDWAFRSTPSSKVFKDSKKPPERCARRTSSLLKSHFWSFLYVGRWKILKHPTNTGSTPPR